MAEPALSKKANREREAFMRWAAALANLAIIEAAPKRERKRHKASWKYWREKRRQEVAAAKAEYDRALAADR